VSAWPLQNETHRRLARIFGIRRPLQEIGALSLQILPKPPEKRSNDRPAPNTGFARKDLRISAGGVCGSGIFHRARGRRSVQSFKARCRPSKCCHRHAGRSDCLGQSDQPQCYDSRRTGAGCGPWPRQVAAHLRWQSFSGTWPLAPPPVRAIPDAKAQLDRGRDGQGNGNNDDGCQPGRTGRKQR
jgi:hypothetical protein